MLGKWHKSVISFRLPWALVLHTEYNWINTMAVDALDPCIVKAAAYCICKTKVFCQEGFHTTTRHMSAMASVNIGNSIVCPTVCFRHQSSAWLVFCEANPPEPVGIPSQRANNAENVSITWRRHELYVPSRCREIIESAKTFLCCLK